MARPSNSDQQWYEAAKNFSPQQSLDRTQTLANFVFANVAIVATLLGGLGLLSDKTASLRSAPRVGHFPVPILLVGVSLLAASIAMWPKLKRINPNRADEVERWYTHQIRRRGIAVIVALSALSAAIVVATLSFDSPALNDATISASLGDGATTTLGATVAVTGASRDAVATTTIDQKNGKVSTRLFSAVSRADASGAITVQATLSGVKDSGSFLIDSTVKEGAKVVSSRSLELQASPPSTTPAATKLPAVNKRAMKKR